MLVDEVLKEYTQEIEAGGANTPPEARLFLYSIAKLLRANDILETGFDAGYTTLALAQTGARVVGIDNKSEYPQVKADAEKLLATYDNVELIYGDALSYLVTSPDEAFDFIFIDDYHAISHVALEAEQVKRVLRKGGICAFHDTIIASIGVLIRQKFNGWYIMPYFSCYSPYAERLGKDNPNYGIGLVQRPL